MCCVLSQYESTQMNIIIQIMTRVRIAHSVEKHVPLRPNSKQVLQPLWSKWVTIVRE